MKRFSASLTRWVLPVSTLILLVVLPAVPALAQQMPVTTDSDEARALFEEGLRATANVDRAKARARFDAALEKDPNLAVAHVWRASVSPPAERAEHLQMAQAHAGQASEAEQKLIAAFGAFAAGDRDRELEILNGLAQEYPGDSYLQHFRGVRYYGAERYDEAAAAFNQAIAIDPDFEPAYNMLGYTAFAQGDNAGAEKALKTYQRLAPDDPNPYDSLGELYLRTGRYDEATAEFEKALARDPEFEVSANNLVWVQVEKSNQQFEQHFAQQDAGAMASLYGPGGMLLPAGSEPIEGADAITAYWKSGFDAGLASVDLETDEVLSRDDLAYEMGHYTIKTAGGDVADTGKYIVIWGKDGDAWQMYRDIWNSSRAPEMDAQN